MMMKYIPEFKQWYNSLNYQQYHDHYMAWRHRDACIEQERMIRQLTADKHFPVVYDMSYGGGEYCHIISHDKWIKTIEDDKQEQLVKEIAPTAELIHITRPVERRGDSDLILAMNILRSVKAGKKDFRYMWETPLAATFRNVIFDIIVSDTSWTGMNDTAMNKSKQLSFLDRHGILPYKYWEFPDDVEWYIGYHSAGINWVPRAEICRDKDLRNAALATIDYIYTDISDKKVLDLSYYGLGDYLEPEQIVNLPKIRERYDIVLAMGLLSQIEQFDRFVKSVIGGINADVYIFSGTEAADAPEYSFIDGQISAVAHPYQTYSLSELYIRQEFDYNVYLMRGPAPEDLANDPRAYYGKEIYLVVEASYQIPETIIRTKCYDAIPPIRGTDDD